MMCQVSFEPVLWNPHECCAVADQECGLLDGLILAQAVPSYGMFTCVPHCAMGWPLQGVAQTQLQPPLAGDTMDIDSEPSMFSVTLPNLRDNLISFTIVRVNWDSHWHLALCPPRKFQGRLECLPYQWTEFCRTTSCTWNSLAGPADGGHLELPGVGYSDGWSSLAWAIWSFHEWDDRAYHSHCGLAFWPHPIFWWEWYTRPKPRYVFRVRWNHALCHQTEKEHIFRVWDYTDGRYIEMTEARLLEARTKPSAHIGCIEEGLDIVLRILTNRVWFDIYECVFWGWCSM
jgi:hypothetical protein